MAKELPSEEQIIAILRDEPMVGSQLRSALGLPKKQKMAFKQLLADMIERGVLKRSAHKEYQLGDGEPLEDKREKRRKKLAEQGVEDNRRPGARSRRQTEKDSGTRVKRGILHQTGDEDWQVTEIDTGKVYEMCHRRQAPGKEGETISFTLYPHPKLKHSYLAKVDRSAEIMNVTWDEVKKKFMEESNLPKGFSPAIEKYVASITEPTEKDFKGRVDYRKLDILCIDPEGAMDHDDAISVERKPNGGYKLGVHIADVSYYVPEGSDLDEENFRFYGNYLYGQEAQQPRWRRILSATSSCLGEAVGQLYVEKHFPAEAKERMLNLVGNLRTALGERIKNLDWMSDETKAKALHKLDCFNVKIGYPDKWKDYSKYEVTPESYFENVHRAIRFENEIDMAKIGKPVDKDEWFMTPQTVNAYYSPEMNEIVFPAAILQPPFFNMDADDAVNYGGIGVVIGHEMTHGFDDQGCKYDEKGDLNNWWTEEDATKFNERTAQLVKLFNEFQVRGYQINGELTLGENIADLGGLNIAWDAYQMTDEAKANQSIDGFTPAQRFFISYGTIWRNNSRDKYIERQVKTDVHSPAEARVNRTLGSMPHFYEAFEILPENKMYIAPEERAAIW